MHGQGDFVYYLWKRVQDAGGVRFVHVSDVPNAGFSSVYAVRENDATALERAGTAAGFKGVVCSPTLSVDCDTAEAFNAVTRRLRDRGIAFTAYLSGNRGGHFEIPREIEPSHLLPALDRAWVAENLPEADLSLYSHLHLWRREGAVHEKTGKRKTKVSEQDGTILTAADFADLEPETLVAEPLPSGLQFQCVFTDDKIMSKTVPSGRGGRHKTLCAVAARLQTLGQPLHFVEVWLFNMNLFFDPPLPEADVKRIAAWAYTR